MDINEIKALVEVVDQSSFSTLAFKKDNMELVLKKPSSEGKSVATTEILRESVILAQDTPVNDASDTIVNVTSAELQQGKTLNQELKQDTENVISILAPLVGVFYRASSPEAEPFVTVGQTVSEGDTVCIIEAMKILNEIKAPVSGKILKIHVENDAIVEFNQILMEIGE